jgi:hypothetical protein
MAIIPIEPAIPDLHIPRWQPCSAKNGLNLICGATPASQYRKSCGVAAHEAYVWLCPVHATICATGGGMCKECADNGGVVAVQLVRLDEPIRM